MHILVTGASGLIGSHVVVNLLKAGHLVSATDLNDFSSEIELDVRQYLQQKKLNMVLGDLTSVAFTDTLFAAARSIADVQAVVHIGGIRSPENIDARIVYNINVTSTYNVLYTASQQGIKRIVQASSCNAIGLSWTRPEHWGLEYVPINEKHPMHPEDAYSLSKMAIEEQAQALCRLCPDVRIASIRMHFTRFPAGPGQKIVAKATGLWSWSSVDAVVRACILGITSEGWTGAEAFHIASDTLSSTSELADNGVAPTALSLLEQAWNGRVKTVDLTWWKDNPYRSFVDTSKAQRLLGWRHDV